MGVKVITIFFLSSFCYPHFLIRYPSPFYRHPFVSFFLRPKLYRGMPVGWYALWGCMPCGIPVGGYTCGVVYLWGGMPCGMPCGMPVGLTLSVSFDTFLLNVVFKVVFNKDCTLTKSTCYKAHKSHKKVRNCDLSWV